ncbi:MAG: helix-turn-helix domain-containing protein [Verrucomicrobiales bacterium]
MERAGIRLQRARETKNLSLEEVARETNVRIDRLRDLEDDNYGNFPSPTYAKGFLNLYAKFLRVDVSRENDMFDVDHSMLVGSGAGTFSPSGLFRNDGGVVPKQQAGHVSRTRTSTFSLRSFAPVAFALGLVLIVGVGLVMKFSMDMNRIQRSEPNEASVAAIESIIEQERAAESAATPHANDDRSYIGQANANGYSEDDTAPRSVNVTTVQAN